MKTIRFLVVVIIELFAAKDDQETITLIETHMNDITFDQYQMHIWYMQWKTHWTITICTSPLMYGRNMGAKL